MDREQRLDQHVDEDVVPAVMRQFVRDREVADLPLAAGHETVGQGDDLVEHAECHRARDRGGLDHADIVDFADRARILE